MADHNGYRTGGHSDRRSGSCDDDAIHVVSRSGSRSRVAVNSETGRKLKVSSRSVPVAPRESESRALTSTVYDYIEIHSSDAVLEPYCVHTAEGLTASTRRGRVPSCGRTTYAFS